MAELRALTVKQPWAHMIAHCGKATENRTRLTRYRGLLAIHAGAYSGWDRDAETSPVALEAWRKWATIPASGELAAPLTRSEAYSWFKFGAVIAVADLVDCHPWWYGTCDPTRNGKVICSPWAVTADGAWHWRLASIRPLAAPVTARGALGLWRLPETQRSPSANRSGLPVADHGPYQDERQAHAAAIAAIPPKDGRSILRDSQNRQLLEDACAAASVELAAFDRRIIDWLAGFEDSTCMVFAGLILRAWEAGKTTAAEGTVTEWGLRLTGESCEPIFSAYPGEEAARYAVPGFQGVFDTVVVRRECGPWKEAPDTCRHCGQPIRRCPHQAGTGPVCKGWRHEGYEDQPIGSHYCEGRSVSPSAEPATRDATAPEIAGEAGQ